jgi:hypothetical protein
MQSAITARESDGFIGKEFTRSLTGRRRSCVRRYRLVFDGTAE